MVDATYLKVRVDHRIRPMALMIAMGMTRDGVKELIGFRLKACESRETWGEVPLLAARPRAFGLKHVYLRRPRGARVRTAEGLLYPDVPWQRFQAHFSRNVFDAAPKRLRACLCLELVEMFNCATLKEARARRDEITAD